MAVASLELNDALGLRGAQIPGIHDRILDNDLVCCGKGSAGPEIYFLCT